MPRGRKKQNVLTLEEQLVTVNERIQEVENELKQFRSQRKEIQTKIEEQEKETLFRAVVASGRTVEVCRVGKSHGVSFELLRRNLLSLIRLSLIRNLQL